MAMRQDAIVEGRCESIQVWVRAKVLEDRNIDWEQLESGLRNELERFCQKTLVFNFFAVDDRYKKDNLHARYLLSVRGGIRFDKGFQTQKRSRFDVTPIGSGILKVLDDKFISGRNDLYKKKVLTIKI